MNINTNTSFPKERYEFVKTIRKKNISSEASVYLMRETTNLQCYVIKKIKENIFNTKSEIEREVKIGKALDSNYFAKTYNHYFNESKNKHYIVIQYKKGITLDKYKQQNKISFGDFKTILYQIFNAIIYSLEKNICPLDIKDTNILINPMKEITFIDFNRYTMPEDGSSLDMTRHSFIDMGQQISRVILGFLNAGSDIKDKSNFEEWKNLLQSYQDSHINTRDDYINWCKDLLNHPFLNDT